MSEQEFRSIYKQYHKKLCYFLNYYTHDEQAIEEVVQDVFVYLWKESDNLNITYLKTYLYSSARNRMLNYLRNEHTRTIILERWAQMELEERQAQDCIDRAGEQGCDQVIHLVGRQCFISYGFQIFCSCKVFQSKLLKPRWVSH